jgi:cysteinyl-tRNA synthetase
MPYLRVLSSFRDEVRRLALKGANSKEILELCDRLRDNELIDLGVALDDQEGMFNAGATRVNIDKTLPDGNAMVKLAPAEELRRARDEKKAAAEAKLARKAAAAKDAQAKRLAKLEKGKLSPDEMYRPPNVAENLYSEWDAEGIPTKDGEGVELSKAKSKKFKKDRDIQAKLHQEWLNEVNKNGAVI